MPCVNLRKWTQYFKYLMIKKLFAHTYFFIKQICQTFLFKLVKSKSLLLCVILKVDHLTKQICLLFIILKKITKNFFKITITIF